jgi:hypothetical protein
VTTSECLAALVVPAETEQVVEALKAARRVSDLCHVSDEDHGFVRPGDPLTFYAVAEAFLAKYLYGKAYRVRADFTSSTIKFANRWRLVPGLPG